MATTTHRAGQRLALVCAVLCLIAGFLVQGQTTAPSTAPVAVKPVYTPAAKSSGLTATRVYVGDKVAAWGALPSADYTRWNAPFNLGDPIPGIGSAPWNESPGCFVDTSAAGTFPIKKNGFDCGSLQILPALPVVAFKVTTTAELEAAITTKPTLTSMTVLHLAPGVYEPQGTQAPTWWGNLVMGNVTLVADGPVTIRSKTPTNNAAFIVRKGDMYVEGCTLDGLLFSTATGNRITLTRCEIKTQILHVAGEGGGNGALINLVADQCRIVDGGSLFVGTPFLIERCEFTESFNYPHPLLVSGNGAVHKSIFKGSARGIVLWTCTGTLIDNNTFDAVEGVGNGGENFLVENQDVVTGLCINRNTFLDSAGTSIQFSANKPCRGNIISNNRMRGVSACILLYNQAQAGVIDDTAVFGNYGQGATFLLASPALDYATNASPFGTVSNTRGGNNVFVNQTPSPDPTGMPKVEYGSFNPYPATYADATWVQMKHPTKGWQVNALQTVGGKFYPEQINVTCSVTINSVRYSFTPTEWLDDKTVVFGGWAGAAPGPVPAFTIVGPQPVYTVKGFNNTVGVSVINPFTKPAFIQAGDAQLLIR